MTYADATTRADAAFPAAIGKRLPTVPEWKATMIATWRPADGVAPTAAGRYASRLYGTLDNSDTVGNTYQGFHKYLIIDLRTQFAVGKNYALGIGIDNLNNDRYFLFHPFPQPRYTPISRCGSDKKNAAVPGGTTAEFPALRLIRTGR